MVRSTPRQSACGFRTAASIFRIQPYYFWLISERHWAQQSPSSKQVDGVYCGRVGTRKFTRSELESFNGATVDDLVADNLKLLFVGINPGLWTAAVNTHFARPGNRFWPAMHRAGITPDLVDAGDGLTHEQRLLLLETGVGITNLVPVATARADELSRQQIVDGGEKLRHLVRKHQPRVVAMLGITSFRQAFSAPKTVLGKQREPFEGAELWVLSTPSGLNAHETVSSLGEWFRQVAQAAGL